MSSNIKYINETWLSNQLVWLLDSNGSHGLGNEFAKEFFKEALLKIRRLLSKKQIIHNLKYTFYQIYAEMKNIDLTKLKKGKNNMNNKITSLEFKNTRAGAIYKVDRETVVNFNNIIKEKYNGKALSGTISDKVINYSEIYEYGIDLNLEKGKLKKIYSISFFKEFDKETYAQNFLLFIVEYKDYSIPLDKFNYLVVNNEVNEFFKSIQGFETWTQKIGTQNILSRYIYDQKEVHEEIFIRKSIGASDSVSFIENKNYIKTNKNSFYFSKNNLLELTNIKMDASYDKRMLACTLGLAYKEYFKDQVSFIADESLKLVHKMSADEIKDRYSNLLDYTNSIAIFETAYYFHEPILESSEQAYLMYPLLNEGLKIFPTYKEFKDNLNSLMQTISILEARIRKEEREHIKILEEKAEKKEKKFTALVGTITGIIAILTFFADWPSIMKNATTFDSTWYITLGAFVVTSFISFKIFKSITKDQSKEG